MPENDTFDFDSLKSVIARLWRPAGHLGEPLLALECITGPYRGVVFSFTTFEVVNGQMVGGFVPMRFNTTVHQAPQGFVADEAFDRYCSEVLLAWLSYIATRPRDISALVRAETQGVH